VLKEKMLKPRSLQILFYVSYVLFNLFTTLIMLYLAYQIVFPKSYI
jgi:phage shock protein PspC (stress-responsive transcriptional regulator)